MQDGYAWLVYALAAVGFVAVTTWLRSWIGALLPYRRRTAFLTVLIRVYNGGDVIEGFLRPLLMPHLFGWRPRADFDIVVLDLGSTDETPAIVEKLARKHAGLRLERAPGQGAAPGSGPVKLVVDLRQGADTAAAYATLARLLGEQTRRRDRRAGSTAAGAC